MTWETVIGLEIHVQMNTQSKIFSGASTAFGADANTHTSVVDLAMPGALPVMNRAVIEKGIKLLADKARDGKLSVEDLTGGTFTITNGGVFGSLMSTPIINPPQSAILGMHKIQERPMAVNGQVEILPMMYLALSYDHRLIDGKEAVGFLVTIKELLEEPAKLILDL